jgi:SAM-dependent methyltransferase
MDNTKQSFLDKWTHNEALAFGETLREGSEIQNWILTRNGFLSRTELASFLEGKRRILDAGCGNGRVTALLRECSPAAEIVGIDAVSAEIASRNLSSYKNVRVLSKDLLSDLRDLGQFDFIYCQEVLHHTADPQRAFSNLAALLDPGGELAVYVYRKKAPAREFNDDYIRERISGLSYEEAMAVCRQITAFGKAVAEKNVTVQVPAVDVLEIPAGEYSAQRLIYHFFMKCFWNSNLSFEENAAINYDWYHPQLSSRHTLEEVRTWFSDLKLDIIHECVDFYGITVRGRRA